MPFISGFRLGESFAFGLRPSRLVHIAIPVILAFLACAAPSFSAGENAFDLLRASIEAPTHLSYSGQLQSIQFGHSKSVATVYKVDHRAPSLTRRWYIAPQSLYSDSIVTRGTESYNVDMHAKRIIESRNNAVDDQVALDDNFGLLTANYRATFGADESIAGRQTSEVILTNKYTGQIGMRVWVDKETKLVLEKQTYAPNGSITQESRFDQIQYTNNQPDGIFSVPALAGFTQVKGLSHGAPSSDLASVIKAAGFNARGPKYLPDGFLPITGDVSDIKGVRTLHILYSDGIRTLSLFENNRNAAIDLSHYKVNPTNVDKHAASYVLEGSTSLLTWQEEDGLFFALVGELSRKELLRIASSVEPEKK